MSTRRLLLCLVICAAVSGACGDDKGDTSQGGSGSGSGGAASGSGGAASVASCNAQCDAQEKVRGTGCEPFVDLADCKQLCTQLTQNIKDCGAQFNAYYDCSTADGFVCLGSLVTNKTKACDDELAALNSCTSGGGGSAGSGGATCKGENDHGTCPQVPCPCAEGTKMVSGFDTSGPGCACLDSVTCKDLFCD